MRIERVFTDPEAKQTLFFRISMAIAYDNEAGSGEKLRICGSWLMPVRTHLIFRQQ